MEGIKMSYLDRAKELAPVIVKDRRVLHSKPELGMNLEHTVDYVYNRNLFGLSLPK